MNIGFDNQKYLQMQSEHIRERISMFGNKLYLEFGGKLFDDYHASRVLPGFQPDSKLKMLLQLKDQAEIVIAISAGALESNKMRRVFNTPISGKPYQAYFFSSNLFLCIAYYRTLQYNLFIHYI